MILIDFSSVIHRKLYSAISTINPTKVDGKYITSEFIGLTLHYILEEIFETYQQFNGKFGDIILCLDNHSAGYWRRDVYSGYKASRKVGREESDIDFPEVFVEVNKLVEQLKENVPWKVLEVPKAEADDIMLVLAKEFNQDENILIHSPDKDMIQAQRENSKVFQYSPLTNKWLVPENKYKDMDHWIKEHVCLGDASDDVPKIVDHTEFSENFLKYLSDRDFDFKTPLEFKDSDLDSSEKLNLLNDFDIYKTNRKGESTGVKDIYKDVRFGSTTLEKAVEKHGSLDNFLDSHPLYRKHYDRNFTLVMEEGIPEYIRTGILESFKNASIEYNNIEFEKYLKESNLNNILMLLPNIFKINHALTAADFDW